MPGAVQFILGFWVMGPPLWFAAEYFLVNSWLRLLWYPKSRYHAQNYSTARN